MSKIQFKAVNTAEYNNKKICYCINGYLFDTPLKTKKESFEKAKKEYLKNLNKFTDQANDMTFEKYIKYIKEIKS